MRLLDEILGRLQAATGWKLFVVGGGILIILGESADLLLDGHPNLLFQLLVLALMAALLLYTLRKR